MRDWLGQGGGESYVDYFVKTKTAEFSEYHGPARRGSASAT